MKVLSLRIPATPIAIPLVSAAVECGFPSPAEPHAEEELDLNDLISHPSATYFARANGDSLSGLGILYGDLLIVDRSLSPRQNDVVVVSLNGELACKIMDLKHQCFRSANPAYPPLPVPEGMDVVIEGVVIHAVHHLRRS